MTKQALLLRRLEEIGQSLEKTGKALALIGLGSVGRELDRLDEYSDLDFFVIVERGYKQSFIQNLEWLSSIYPIAYQFQNTVDGYKLLFQDGVFCEFAVFEEAELGTISFAAGRIVWQREGVGEANYQPVVKAEPAPKSPEWSLGEALTNLYVGLGRYHRGEKLSALRFIQYYAVDRLMELSERIEAAAPVYVDSFASERRYEQRFPKIAQELPQFMQGYDRSPESARAILTFLDQHFVVNPAIKQAILSLCQ
ncbi:MAG: hypothetical protein L0332_21910 [Chloroflexi bacterium]|nr:hypothetical protein [Chloroflexota bacterium]MCI0649571.1 hypothetical protein [Chloroflexota bacterium]MCI0729353.1 hypothetical protein [Chloroflexota bacterium]